MSMDIKPRVMTCPCPVPLASSGHTDVLFTRQLSMKLAVATSSRRARALLVSLKTTWDDAGRMSVGGLWRLRQCHWM